MPIDFVKNSCLSFERRLKAVIEAGGCHVEGKKTRFKSYIVTIIVYSCYDLIFVEKMK